MTEQGWEVTLSDGSTKRTASRRVRDRWLREGYRVTEVWRVGSPARRRRGRLVYATVVRECVCGAWECVCGASFQERRGEIITPRRNTVRS